VGYYEIGKQKLIIVHCAIFLLLKKGPLCLHKIKPHRGHDQALSSR